MDERKATVADAGSVLPIPQHSLLHDKGKMQILAALYFRVFFWFVLSCALDLALGQAGSAREPIR